MPKLPRVLIDTEQQDWMILNGCWLVDSLTPDSHKSKAEETLQRVLAQAAEILGDHWNLLACFFASEGEMAKAYVSYERICKKWAKRVVHHDGPCESRWEFCRHASLGIFHFEHLQLWTLWDLWDFQASLSDLSKSLLLAACIPDSEPGSPVRIESIADRTGVTEQLGRLGDGGAWWYQLQPACYVWFIKDIYWHQTATVSVFVQISLQTFLFKSLSKVVSAAEPDRNGPGDLKALISALILNILIVTGAECRKENLQLAHWALLWRV